MDGLSIVSYVKKYVASVFKDSARSTEQKIGELLEAQPRFVQVATLARDKSTLEYFVQTNYIAVLGAKTDVLQTRTPPKDAESFGAVLTYLFEVMRDETMKKSLDAVVVASAPAVPGNGNGIEPSNENSRGQADEQGNNTGNGNGVDQDKTYLATPEFMTLYGIEAEKMYSIPESLKLLFPALNSADGKAEINRLYMRVRGTKILADIFAVDGIQSDRRTSFYLQGKNVPESWKRIVSRWDDFKGKLSPETVTSVLNYGSFTSQAKADAAVSDAPVPESALPSVPTPSESSRQVTDQDVISISKLGQLLGKSADELRGTHSEWIEIGTTQCLRVGEIKEKLTLQQRFLLPTLVE